MRRVDLGIGTFTDGRDALAALGSTDTPVSIASTADLDAIVAGFADLWAALRQLHHGAMPEAMQKRYEAAYALLPEAERIAAIDRFNKGGE